MRPVEGSRLCILGHGINRAIAHATSMHLVMTKFKYNRHSSSVDALEIEHLRNEHEFTLFHL